MSGSQSTSEFLGTEPIRKLLWRLSIPAVISTTVNMLYNIVDRLYIGNGVGKEAIAGLVLTTPYMIILGAFGMMFGAGSGALISMYLGERRRDEAERVLGQLLFLCLFFIITVQFLALALLDKTLVLFGGNAVTIPYAHEYLSIVLWGNVFQHLSFSLSAQIRAEGNSKKAMSVIVLGAVSNIILDPIFIFGFKLGIAGAAYATVLSMCISSSRALWHFIKGQGVLRFHWRNILPRPHIIVRILSIGIAPCLMQFAGSAINIVVNNCFNHYADSVEQASDAIATWGNVGSILMITLMPVIGLTQGMQPIVGFNTGSGQFDRVRETLLLALKIAFTMGVACWALVMAGARLLIMAFNRDPGMVTMGVHATRIIFLVFPVIGVTITMGNYFQATGRAGLSIFISLSRQVLCLIPLMLVMSYYYRIPGIWWSMPLGDVVAVAVAGCIAAREFRRLNQKCAAAVAAPNSP